MTAVTDQELMGCVGAHSRGEPDTCWIFDPDNQMSTRLLLERGEEFQTWYVRNGSLTLRGMTVPLHTEIVACSRHRAILEAESEAS